MSSAVETSRQAWEEGHRRLEAEARDPARYNALLRHVEVVTEELRKRIGEKFTLAELAEVYATADSWSRDAVAEHAATPGWARTLALVEDSAFHLYARGASDYRP